MSRAPLISASDNVPQYIFRAYDIRGTVEDALTEEVVHDIGVALGSEVQSHGLKQIVVARDGRLSSPALHQALIKGLISTGCDVINIGLVPTPVLYFAVHHLEIASGVMLTGSHNPSNYNGLKMVVAGKTLTSERVQGLYQRIIKGEVLSGAGQVSEVDVSAAYVQKIVSSVPLKRKMKIVVDAGNGAAGEIGPRLYRAMGCEVISLYCDIDGRFPNHHPDPSKPENLKDIIEAVEKHQADVGLAFDGDADRIGVVTPKGQMIFPDRLLMLYAKAVLQEHPGQEILFDVKCSKNLATVIAAAGGKPVMYKTGHSLLKNKMLSDKAILAGEMSGHIFFNDPRWYGFDDGLYCGARLLEILSHNPADLDAIFADIPNSLATPEIQVAIVEEEKFAYMQQLSEQVDFPGANIITIDGLRIEFSDGWALIRPSNTTPCLTLRFEADNSEALMKIQARIKAFMLQSRPSLELPF